MKNGGYAIISHDDINIFNKIDSAYKSGKPILFYDDDKTCFYVDSVKVNGDGDYVFTKGGKTWTVTDSNTLSSEGNLQNHLYLYSVDFRAKYDEDITTDFCLRFYSSNDNITQNDLYTNNDIKNQYCFTLLQDSSGDGGNNVYSIEKFIGVDTVNIMDATNGSNEWEYSNLSITKVQLF